MKVNKKQFQKIIKEEVARQKKIVDLEERADGIMKRLNEMGYGNDGEMEGMEECGEMPAEERGEMTIGEMEHDYVEEMAAVVSDEEIASIENALSGGEEMGYMREMMDVEGMEEIEGMLSEGKIGEFLKSSLQLSNIKNLVTSYMDKLTPDQLSRAAIDLAEFQGKGFNEIKSMVQSMVSSGVMSEGAIGENLKNYAKKIAKVVAGTGVAGYVVGGILIQVLNASGLIGYEMTKLLSDNAVISLVAGIIAGAIFLIISISQTKLPTR